MSRDCEERGRTVDQVVQQYHETVRPMHEKFVEPCKCIADLIMHSTPKSMGRLDIVCGVLANHLKAVSGIDLESNEPLSLPIPTQKAEEEKPASKELVNS